MNSKSHQQYFSELLDRWEERSEWNADLEPLSIVIHKPDLIKLSALAELYQLPRQEVAAHLLQMALKSLEEAMPYVPGSKVIRIEEGNEVYEDIGPLPRYLEAKERQRRASDK